MLSPLRTIPVLGAEPGSADDGKTIVYNHATGVFDLVASLTVPIPIEDGGTGADNAADALTNLGITGGGDGLAGNDNAFYLYSQFWSF